jgi:hypothetical protein
MRQKIALKDREKSPRKQLNEQFNNIGSYDENKFKKYQCSVRS